MKNYRIVFVFFIVLTWSACQNRRVNGNRFENSMIEMSKGECTGTCPVYSIIISGNGLVKFEGKVLAKRIGKYEKYLSEKEVSRLFNSFECANFSDFRSEYTENVSGMPITWISFDHRGYKKRIRDYYGAPEELKKLEQQVEEIAFSKEGWVQIK